MPARNPLHRHRDSGAKQLQYFGVSEKVILEFFVLKII
jgi:hypothetical protein